MAADLFFSMISFIPELFLAELCILVFITPLFWGVELGAAAVALAIHTRRRYSVTPPAKHFWLIAGIIAMGLAAMVLFWIGICSASVVFSDFF